MLDSNDCDEGRFLENLKSCYLTTNQGRGWRSGEVKEKLAELIARYNNTPKKAAWTYDGPPYGETLFWDDNMHS